MKRYAIMAALIDFYCAGALSNWVAAIFAASTKSAADSTVFLIIGFILFLVILKYHYTWWSGTPHLSPGERLVGRVVRDGQKHWENPYGVTRAGLFIVLWLFFVLVGNTFEAAFDPQLVTTLSLPNLAVRGAFLVWVISAAVAAGAGEPLSGLVPAFYFLVFGLGNYSTAMSGSPLASGMWILGHFGLIMTVATAVVSLAYHRILVRRVPARL